MAVSTMTQFNAYALGHAPDELERLAKQGQFFGDLTAQLLQSAGLRSGMRVLDVGCGAGDVSFLAAGLVGIEGSVIGVDRSQVAIDTAMRRAAALGLGNVRFLQSDITDLDLSEPVDAIVGRLVLMYLSDPAVTLRRLARFLQPGGLVAFHEFDLYSATSEPRCPGFEAAVAWAREALSRSGADPRTGLNLARIFREAGLPQPALVLGARVDAGLEYQICDQAAHVTRSLLPLIERFGIATAAEVGIDTLADRLRAEAVARDATLVSPALVGAWTATAA